MADETVFLDRGNYTSCTINMYGGNITSWRIRNIEQLFLSTTAILDGKVPIRGGIPLLFPQYGPWSFGPHHGFARIMQWKVKKHPTTSDTKDVEVVLFLEDDDYSRSMWNYPFFIEYQIILLEYEIKLSVTIYNTGKSTMYNHIVIHPYIRVPNVKFCKVVGLVREFFDKTTDLMSVDETPITKIYDQTDRVYRNTKNHHIITNIMKNRKLKIEKENCPDIVMWNPWADKAKELVDFGEEDYLKMICFAAGHACDYLQIPPYGYECLSMSMRLMKEDLYAEHLRKPNIEYEAW